MKRKKRDSKINVVLIVLIFLTISFQSCRKKGETIAKIKIINTDGEIVPNAEVILFGEPTLSSHNEMIIRDTLYTKADGYAVFNFDKNYNLGQAGIFVLNIKVSNEASLIGEGIIKVEQEKTSEETVIIQ